MFYAASKHGMIGAVKSVADTYRKTLNLYTVSPGLVDTPLTWDQVRGVAEFWKEAYNLTL